MPTLYKIFKQLKLLRNICLCLCVLACNCQHSECINSKCFDNNIQHLLQFSAPFVITNCDWFIILAGSELNYTSGVTGESYFKFIFAQNINWHVCDCAKKYVPLMFLLAHRAAEWRVNIINNNIEMGVKDISVRSTQTEIILSIYVV